MTSVKAIQPCGSSSSPWKEVLVCVASSGQILSDFSATMSGADTRLAFLTPGSYLDTDESGCNFSVTTDASNLETTVSWAAGQNTYATWQAGSVTCGAPTPAPTPPPAPGIPAVKVGINFEDLGPYGDKDFNDSVLCFKGNFLVNGTSVVSTADQTVVGAISHISACTHHLVIHVTNPDGSHQPDVDVDDANIPAGGVSMHFLAGSVLDVTMQSDDEPCTNDYGAHPDLGDVHDMTDPNYAHVLPNQCNTTGN